MTPVWHALEATLFRYSSPRWLRKYKFILHRTSTIDRTINPREFRVSEYRSGASVTIAYPTRNQAKAMAKARLINEGERNLNAKVKQVIKNNH